MAEAAQVVSRIVGFDATGNRVVDDNDAAKSKQKPEDPFLEMAEYGRTLRIPPFPLEQLVLLYDAMPMHQAAIDQKTRDIIGNGPIWVQDDTETKASNFRASRAITSQEQRDVSSWWDSLSDDYSLAELLNSYVNDYTTLAWGALEIGRDEEGKVKRLYYLPAHTLRAHADSRRYAQWRNGAVVYFKRWGDPTDYYSEDGEVCPVSTPQRLKANEVFLLRTPNRRSSWYGIPGYISAFGWISLAVQARDWNTLFFENHREPRHLFIITGLPEDIIKATDEIEESLLRLQSNPHHNLILPLSGDVTVTVIKLSSNDDIQFNNLIDKCNAETLIAHRMPPDRLGIVRSNNLIGGSTSQLINVVNSTYLQAVVSRDQHMIENRIDRFTAQEYPKATGKTTTYRSSLATLDMNNEVADANVVVLLVKNDLMSINEGRIQLGKEPDPRFGRMSYTEYLLSLGALPGIAAGTPAPGGPHTNMTPGLPPPERMIPGEPQQGRPVAAGQPDNVVAQAAVTKVTEHEIAPIDVYEYVMSRYHEGDSSAVALAEELVRAHRPLTLLR